MLEGKQSLSVGEFDKMQICLVFSSSLVIFIFSFLIFSMFILLFDDYIHLFIFMDSYIGFIYVLGSIHAWKRLGID